MALALIVVGPDKLPEMARSIAKGVMELKKTVNNLKEDLAKDNPLDEVRPQLEDAANSLKKQLGEPDPDGWTGVAGDYDIVDTHEQAINEQASTEEVVVSDIGEKDDEPTDESAGVIAADASESADDIPIEDVDDVPIEDVSTEDKNDLPTENASGNQAPTGDETTAEDSTDKQSTPDSQRA
ncbi:MAG: twin-arginine translocase TatA/TatE family subunit [Desulfobulbaceae bacterium]|nr:twin-arginine translocase TatA/TatE family subunit [Desulfobulbaceae bacterium]